MYFNNKIIIKKINNNFNKKNIIKLDKKINFKKNKKNKKNQ